jgi:hypothetical protein
MLAAAPAIPLHEAGKYVAGAYVVFLALLVIYIAIMATRLSRLDGELESLAELAERRSQEATDPDGADAEAQIDAGGEAEGKMSGRERSSRQDVVPGSSQEVVR